MVPPLDGETRAQMKQWLDQWRRVGPMLDAERPALVDDTAPVHDEEAERHLFVSRG
ncbi:MAG TPA: hypothetical protein VLD67_08290 [Vicinamibacterales bacterium]|nr:hypothetical protein [Vicinamibacterales bacterium]